MRRCAKHDGVGAYQRRVTYVFYPTHCPPHPTHTQLNAFFTAVDLLVKVKRAELRHGKRAAATLLQTGELPVGDAAAGVSGATTHAAKASVPPTSRRTTRSASAKRD